MSHSGIVNGAGDGDRDESLAQETDLCLDGESSRSALSYGADLGLADDSTLIMCAERRCAAATSFIQLCSDTASPSAIAC